VTKAQTEDTNSDIVWVRPMLLYGMHASIPHPSYNMGYKAIDQHVSKGQILIQQVTNIAIEDFCFVHPCNSA